MCLTARVQLDASHLAVEPGLRSLQHVPLDPSRCSSLISSKLDVYSRSQYKNSVSILT
jgi:hypothetical protein